MFNLIMTNQDVGGAPITLEIGRVFEHSDSSLSSQFKAGDEPDFSKLIALPCLFMKEGIGDELAYVGRVTRVQKSGRD